MKKTILFVLAIAVFGVFVAGCNNGEGANPEVGKKGDGKTTEAPKGPDTK